ncbi:MAG: hypothetical protein K2X66_10805 [Cyanobacteria bacterium]|nr:hypothetical protein [Cyanobacteriota bacterium]
MILNALSSISNVPPYFGTLKLQIPLNNKKEKKLFKDLAENFPCETETDAVKFYVSPHGDVAEITINAESEEAENIIQKALEAAAFKIEVKPFVGSLYQRRLKSGLDILRS